MLKSDYILRLVEQLAAFMRKLLARLVEEPDRVEEESDAALRALAGLDLPTVRSLPLAALLALLRRGTELDPGRTLVVAEVLGVQAEADRHMGRPERAWQEKSRAAVLYLEALLRLGEDAPAASVARAEEVLGELADEPLAVEVAARLVRFREQQRRFAGAEDALFELLSVDPKTAAEIGVPFFRRLQGLSDAELVEGGLPREEVEEGFAELQRATGERADGLA